MDRLSFFLDGFRGLRAANTREQLTAILAKAASSCGFDVVVFGLPDTPGLFANTFPDAWRKTYVEEKVGGYDPLVTRASKKLLSATWNELHTAEPVTPREQAVVDLCRDHGWHDGFCVPVRGPGGYMALAVFAGREAAFSPEERQLLAFLVITAHERFQEIMKTGLRRRDGLLSRRQQDCLSFVAAGLTDTVIADRLNITETTVRWHLDNARRKLGAATRAQAVAQATWRGLIQP